MTLEVSIVIGAVLVGGLLLWRPYRRRRSAEEVLETEALAREQDRQRDRAIEAADRYGPTPPAFPG